jgi:hypothetical protein
MMDRFTRISIVVGVIIITVAIFGGIVGLARDWHDRHDCNIAMIYPDWRNNHCGRGNLVYD